MKDDSYERIDKMWETKAMEEKELLKAKIQGDHPMIYFALNPDGLLYNLGNHGDWESAEETARDLRIDPIWTINEDEALNWAEFILTEIKQTRKALEKVSS